MLHVVLFQSIINIPRTKVTDDGYVVTTIPQCCTMQIQCRGIEENRARQVSQFQRPFSADKVNRENINVLEINKLSGKILRPEQYHGTKLFPIAIIC